MYSVLTGNAPQTQTHSAIAAHRVGVVCIAGITSTSPSTQQVTMKRIFVFIALAFSLAFVLSNCSATPRQIAHVTVVSAGAAVSQLHTAHQRVYTRATDELRASIRQRHGTLAEYNREVEPIDAEFTARSEVLQNIDAHLRAAAAIIDASRNGNSTAWIEAVGPVLTALRITLETMQQGNVLPPVPIPPEVLSIMQTLSTLAGESQSDGGAQ